MNNFTKAAYKQNTINEIPRYLMDVIFVLIIFMIIFVNMASNNDFQKIVPLLVVYLAAGFRILPGIVKLSGYLQTIRGLKPSLDLLYKEFDKSEEYYEKRVNSTHQEINFNKDIIIEKLDFSYGDKNILNNLNFRIKSKSITGIVGQSGSGKSTLINLLLGFLNPNKGNIIIDNVNINNFITKWQSNIGYVSQNIFLLDASLRENIAFGVDENKIDYNQLNKVIKYANLDDLVKNLKDGLDTTIGEKGSKISGGQIQRIAIARELYRNPSVLILDEATTGLDYENEKQIFESINKLKNDMTIIIVSHNPSTISFCDKLLDLNKDNSKNHID